MNDRDKTNPNSTVKMFVQAREDKGYSLARNVRIFPQGASGKPANGDSSEIDELESF